MFRADFDRACQSLFNDHCSRFSPSGWRTRLECWFPRLAETGFQGLRGSRMPRHCQCGAGRRPVGTRTND